MSKWLGIVRWDGDHYYSGDEVKGSQIKVENNELFLFHDETEEEFLKMLVVTKHYLAYDLGLINEERFEDE